MSVLLRQPHGFEGLSLVVVVRHFFDLARPQRAYHAHPAGKVRCRFPCPSHATMNRPMARFSPTGRTSRVLQAPTLPTLHPDPDPFADTVVSAELPGVKSDVEVVYLYSWVHLGEDRLPVVAGLRPRKRFYKPTNYLGIVLRHRPCSIPQGLRSRRERLAPTAPRLRGPPRESESRGCERSSLLEGRRLLRLPD